ncbi:MAG: hypothetical protein IKW58_00725 [Alphaproteobacteria bacterium]|nr:hypothetical protein [Alphaproteobacteria bacterium]
MKFWKFFKRKLAKPLMYASMFSLIIYLFVSHIVFYKKLSEYDKPHFLISRITSEFDDVEYMHLLLTIQEISKNNKHHDMLIDFVNSGFPNPCPKILKAELYKMNWEPQAFLIRVKKMFDMYRVYERVERIEETIEFLNGQLRQATDETAIISLQIENLNKEKVQVLSDLITAEEFDFIKEYNGLVARIKY